MSFRTSIRKKLLIFFVAAIIPPLVTLGFLSCVKSSTVINDQFGNYGNYAIRRYTLIVAAVSFVAALLLIF